MPSSVRTQIITCASSATRWGTVGDGMARGLRQPLNGRAKSTSAAVIASVWLLFLSHFANAQCLKVAQNGASGNFTGQCCDDSHTTCPPPVLSPGLWGSLRRALVYCATHSLAGRDRF